MTLIVVQDATVHHTGSSCGTTVGTITPGSNSTVFIGDKLICVEDATLEIPLHNTTDCMTPDGPHSFTPDTIANTTVFINGEKILLVGDSYAADPTTIVDAGSNSTGFID